MYLALFLIGREMDKVSDQVSNEGRGIYYIINILKPNVLQVLTKLQ